MPGPSAVTLLSGGLDSTTCLALAVRDLGNRNVLALTAHYGQRHETEIDAAARIADFFRVEHRIIRLSSIFNDPVGLLLNRDSLMLHDSYEQISRSVGPSPTYVPFRNGTLLSAASAVALSRGYDFVYFGAHAEDAHNWAYPDCTPEFIGAMASAIYIGTYHKLRLITPLEWLTKAEVVRRGYELNAPLHLTMTCYEGTVPACGKCPSCIERLHAFEVIGSPDPIRYAEVQ